MQCNVSNNVNLQQRGIRKKEKSHTEHRRPQIYRISSSRGMASYSPDDGLPVSSALLVSSWVLLSWLTTKNDKKTIEAPSQYTGDAYWD